MDITQKFFETDQFAKYCGIELVQASKGWAKVKMQIQPHHLNGYGVAHGGALFTLADAAFAVASNSYGNVALAINASIMYVTAAREGWLFAEAKELSINPKIATYQIDITDEQGDRIASFQGMVYRKKDSAV